MSDRNRPSDSALVKYDGEREHFSLSHEDALTFAKEAANDFGVWEGREVFFDTPRAKEALGQSKAERKKARRAKEKAPESNAGAE